MEKRKPSPSCMDRLRAAHPDCDDTGLVVHAVHAFQDPKDIVEFVGEYVQAVQRQYALEFQEALRVSRVNVGYSLGYLSAQEVNVWRHTLRHAQLLPGPVTAAAMQGNLVVYSTVEELKEQLALGLRETL